MKLLTKKFSVQSILVEVIKMKESNNAKQFEKLIFVFILSYFHLLHGRPFEESMFFFFSNTYPRGVIFV